MGLSDTMTKHWHKKCTKHVNYIAEGELYDKKIITISLYVHHGAFTSDADLMDYIEYRLNLDAGTKGLIILENLTTITEGENNEICNDT